MADEVVVPGVVVPPVVSPAGAAWYEGKVDPGVLGLWQNKGWDHTDPVKLANQITTAYNEAEKFIGAPSNEIIRMPKPGDEAGTKAMWQRLGAPADAAGYDFSGVKTAAGTDPDASFQDFMRTQAAGLHLPKDTASALASAFVKFTEGQKLAADATTAASLVTAKADLAKNWGQNFEANKFVATQAARALGIDAETVTALENQVGYAKVMEMFRTIGTKIGEDKFVTGSNSPSGVMTRDQAIARKAELMADKEWTKSYMNGDAAKGREMKGLLTLIVGDDTEESRGQ
jgi:hypothetical protein